MENQIVKLYLINNAYHELKNCTTNEERINTIIKNIDTNENDDSEVNINTNRYVVGDIKYTMYHQERIKTYSEWSVFFPEKLFGTEERGSSNHYMILFIDAGHFLFIFIGGKAYSLIANYLDHNFGIKVISKLTKSEEDYISRIKSVGLTGSRAGISEQYRESISVLDYINFGKVPIEIDYIFGETNSKTYFSFLQENNDELIKVQVGKSFKVRKQISFEQLNQIINELETIMSLSGTNNLTMFEEITDKKDINEVYKPLLTKKIFDDRQNILKTFEESKPKFHFDFSNSNKMGEFYAADRYDLYKKNGRGHVRFDTVYDRDKIYYSVIKQAKETIDEINEFKMRTFLQGVRVRFYPETGKPSKTPFLNHFSAELKTQYRKSIFLIDNKWYLLKDKFLSSLEQECKQLIKKNYLDKNLFDTKWDKDKYPTEHDYNLSYKGREGYIVLDKIIVENIELCDVMIVKDNVTYLVHLKMGFNASVRELTNQLILSAHRISNDIKVSDTPYIRGIYSKYQASDNYDNGITEENFISAFENRIEYVFAFKSNHKDEGDIAKDISQYSSNIARYSLVQCNKEMRLLDYELRIVQV